MEMFEFHRKQANVSGEWKLDKTRIQDLPSHVGRLVNRSDTNGIRD